MGAGQELEGELGKELKENEKLGKEIKEKEKLEEKRKYNYMYYIFIMIMGLYMRNNGEMSYIVVDGAGGVVPLLFTGIREIALRWLPLMGVVGILMTTIQEQLEDIYTLYKAMSIMILVIIVVTKAIM